MKMKFENKNVFPLSSKKFLCGYELLAGYEFNRYILVWNAECEICYYRNSKAKHYVSTSRILGILLFQ